MLDETTDREIESLVAAADEMGELLHRYIDVHNRIFKNTLRHIIPMWGIFKPINFQQHFESLGFIEMELERVVARIPKSPLSKLTLAATLSAYGSSLLDAITQLQGMCASLFQKADGTLKYSKADYQRDYDKYEECVIRYKHLGAELNALMGR